MTYLEVISGGRPFNDAEWLCSDCNGELGIFITAGFGPVPRSAYLNESEYDHLLAWIDSLDIDIQNPAPRGIFVYDYSPECGSYGWYDQRYGYRRLSPEKSGEVLSMDALILSIAKRNQILNVDFKIDAVVFVEHHFHDLNFREPKDAEQGKR